MEKPFLISIVSFLIEIVSFFIGLTLIRRDRSSRPGINGRVPLLTVTGLAAVLTLLFPILFLLGAPTAIWTMHPIVAISLVVAITLPVVQFVAGRRTDRHV
jgi:amino acid transporter